MFVGLQMKITVHVGYFFLLAELENGKMKKE